MVDEHAVLMLAGVAGKGNQVFVVYVDDAKPIPMARYYLLDLATGRGPMLTDPRIEGELVLWHPSGFVMTHLALFSLPKNVQLDNHGAFQGYIEFDSIKNWPKDIAFQRMYSNQTRWVVNYDRPTMEKMEADTQFLGSIDPATSTFEELFAVKKKPEHLMSWLPLGPNYLLLNITTGGATIYDGKTFKSKRLLPDLDVLPSKNYEAALKTGLTIPPFLKYTPIIKFPAVMSEQVSFVRKLRLNGEQWEECVLIDQSGRIVRKRDSLQLIWEHEGTGLYLDLKEKTFAIKR